VSTRLPRLPKLSIDPRPRRMLLLSQTCQNRMRLQPDGQLRAAPFLPHPPELRLPYGSGHIYPVKTSYTPTCAVAPGGRPCSATRPQVIRWGAKPSRPWAPASKRRSVKYLLCCAQKIPTPPKVPRGGAQSRSAGGATEPIAKAHPISPDGGTTLGTRESRHVQATLSSVGWVLAPQTSLNRECLVVLLSYPT
jgi:hypothetical protein